MELRDFVKTKNIFKIAPDKTLSQALSTLKTSHDAAFVFEKNKYLGVINPYYSIIKTSLPGNAKIEHYLFHAPRIKQNDSVAKAARLMIESKVHYLPVFNEREDFVGITSARRLFDLFKSSTAFDQNLGEFIKKKNQSLLTVYDTDFVSSAVQIFKKRKVSKLVVINKSMKLYGILTYYDLIHYLITPRKKIHRGDRDGVRSEFSHQKVKNLAKTYVLTLTKSAHVREALNLILDKKIGSVVVVDEGKTPIGIITTRDLLNLLIRHHREKRLEITAKNLSRASRAIVQQFTGQFRHWINKLPNIQRAKLFVKEEKQGGLFKTVLSLTPQKGKKKIISGEGKNLTKVLSDIKKKEKAIS